MTISIDSDLIPDTSDIPELELKGVASLDTDQFPECQTLQSSTSLAEVKSSSSWMGGTVISTSSLPPSDRSVAQLPALDQPMPMPSFKMEPVCSPLRLPAWQYILCRYPNRGHALTILKIISSGADLQFDGDRKDNTMSRNHPSARQKPEVLDKYFLEETALGRIKGPFDSPPFPNLRVSPLGLVPKDVDKFRIVIDYSFPLHRSVNEDLLHLECDLQSFDDAMKMLADLPNTYLLIKMDVKAAFRSIPVRQEDHHLLGMQWRGKYYYDTCLPFGLKNSPSLWERFSRMLEWILRTYLGVKHVAHYVDDFLIPVPNLNHGIHLMALVKKCWAILGIPASDDKCIGPFSSLVYLGILVDMAQKRILVPDDKKTKAVKTLNKLLSTKVANIKDIESILGSLTFLAKVVPQGRAFLGRLRHSLTQATGTSVNLDPGTLWDIRWWRTTLPTWSGVSLIREATITASHDIQLCTDASGIGMGAMFGSKWFQLKWDSSITKLNDATQNAATYLELLAIAYALNTWGPELERKRILFYTDCKPAMFAINRAYSPVPRILTVVRQIVILSLKYNFDITLHHIDGTSNLICDFLSRNFDQAQSSFKDQFPILSPSPVSPKLEFPTISLQDPDH